MILKEFPHAVANPVGMKAAIAELLGATMMVMGRSSFPTVIANIARTPVVFAFDHDPYIPGRGHWLPLPPHFNCGASLEYIKFITEPTWFRKNQTQVDVLLNTTVGPWEWVDGERRKPAVIREGRLLPWI